MAAGRSDKALYRCRYLAIVEAVTQLIAYSGLGEIQGEAEIDLKPLPQSLLLGEDAHIAIGAQTFDFNAIHARGLEVLVGKGLGVCSGIGGRDLPLAD